MRGTQIGSAGTVNRHGRFASGSDLVRSLVLQRCESSPVTAPCANADTWYRLNDEPDRVDISDLSQSQRDMLWMRLRADDVLYSYDGQTVTVPNTSVEELTSALSWVDNELQPMPESYPTPRPLQRVGDDGSIVASRWRRIASWYVDAAVMGVPLTVASRAGIGWWLLLPVSAFYVIGMTHIWGRTVGKFAAGTEVVDQPTGELPSWIQSAVRWGVVASVGIAASLFGRGLLLPVVVAQFAIYVPILWDPQGRGLHDRAARTYVRASR